MADLVLGPLHAVDSLPLGSAGKPLGVAVVILTKEDDFGGDLMGHGGRAGWFLDWLDTASAVGATRPRSRYRSERGGTLAESFLTFFADPLDRLVMCAYTGGVGRALACRRPC